MARPPRNNRKTHQYTSHELAMRVVLFLQKHRTRSSYAAMMLVRGRFEVSKATAYRLVAHAGAALGTVYHREAHSGHRSLSSGYPRM